MADLRLPHGVNFVSLERKEGMVYIPHGGTIILAGDLITLIVRLTKEDTVKEIFGENLVSNTM